MHLQTVLLQHPWPWHTFKIDRASSHCFSLVGMLHCHHQMKQGWLWSRKILFKDWVRHNFNYCAKISQENSPKRMQQRSNLFVMLWTTIQAKSRWHVNTRQEIWQSSSKRCSLTQQDPQKQWTYTNCTAIMLIGEKRLSLLCSNVLITATISSCHILQFSLEPYWMLQQHFRNSPSSEACLIEVMTPPQDTQTNSSLSMFVNKLKQHKNKFITAAELPWYTRTCRGQSTHYMSTDNFSLQTIIIWKTVLTLFLG